MAALRRLPLTVLTGFLGSGKTTVLNRLLRDPLAAGTMVLVNELGEVGIDHLLVRAVEENVLLLESGCLCCAMRGDMVSTLRDLWVKRANRRIARFRRVLVETSGLADPAPILHTLMTDALVAERFRLAGVVTTVDATNGMATLDRHVESIKQAALADRVLLTKGDLTTPQALETITARVARINPGVPIIRTVDGAVDPHALIDLGLARAETRALDVARWLRAPPSHAGCAADCSEPAHAHPRGEHDDGILSFCLTFPAPLDWNPFAAALQSLIDDRGADLLRVKGLLAVAGEETPVVVHGVQHVFHPPAALPAWPDAERASRLVFITRGVDRREVEQALAAFGARQYVAGAGGAAARPGLTIGQREQPAH